MATQLVTVGATLGGVVLTLTANALLERRRARDAQRLEAMRLAAEHTKWLREERMKAYAALSLAAEDAFRFLRTELAGDGATSTRWIELRAELRKAYNQVVLLGAEEPRVVALRLWKVARTDVNGLLRDIADGTVDTLGAAAPTEVDARVSEVLTRLGDETNNFLKACRADLQTH